MNKLSLLVLIFLLVNNCSINKKQKFWGKEKSNIQEKENVKIILTNQVKNEKELNINLEIKFTEDKINKNFNNNQNDSGQSDYKGILKKVGKFKYSKFNDFDHVKSIPIFYKENLIFFDNKGTIIFYDQNYKILWKKNFYNKSEKKSRPRLNLAIYNDVLIVTDDIAKYYAIDLKTREIIWMKNNIAPFNSDIKIKDNNFYVVDYKNILRSISISDGSEIWNLKTDESLTKSNTKFSIVIDNKNIYFNNSIGDITAAEIKSGKLLWQLPTQSNVISENAFQLSNSKLIINKNVILFSNNKDEFYSVDTRTGLINWKSVINSVLKPVVIGKFIVTVSSKGYLYLIDKQSGNIIRINDLYKKYNYKKRMKIFPTGFLVANTKIYLTNNDGKLIIANLNTGNVLNIIKISNDKILHPFVNKSHLLIIRNGSIVKFN